MKEYHVLSLGAGVQSTALYLMALRGELEGIKFDYAAFADTQEEPESVYRHLEWLKSLNGPPIITGTAGKLGKDILAGTNTTEQHFVSIPAYIRNNDGESTGKVRRQCTSEYKINVIEQIIRREILGLKPRSHVPKGTNVIQYFGLSFDEPTRIVRVKARFENRKWTEPRFPLWDEQMTRRDCQLWLESQAIPHQVPRSACVFCPYHSNAEWRNIRDNDPHGWSRAIEIDEGLRNGNSYIEKFVDSPMYLHRSCKPLKEAVIDTPESRGEQYLFGFAQECEGMCGL